MARKRAVIIIAFNLGTAFIRHADHVSSLVTGNNKVALQAGSRQAQLNLPYPLITGLQENCSRLKITG